MAQFPAHIRFDNTNKVVQTASEHCRNAANYAQKTLVDNDLGITAYFAGLLHDMGKFKNEYKAYLENAVANSNAVRGTVNHTFAAVRFLLNRYHFPDKTEKYVETLTSEIIAYACGSHHGVFDCVNPFSVSGFEYRVSKVGIGYDESVNNFLKECATKDELDNLFSAACEEISQFCVKITSEINSGKTNDEAYFIIGLLARLLLSAVIEGDRRDTAEFMSGNMHDRQGKPKESKPHQELWEDVLFVVEKKIREFPTETPIQRARAAISNSCKNAGNLNPGVFRLNVPTGAGKTLSSLRFSIAHAMQFEKKHIIFTAPLLSILDQNSTIIREYVGNDEIVLEHFSNVVNEHLDSEDINRYDLLTDNWDSPIIITTLVQFLNTLFCEKTSCIRRFHALCDSVIIIDEVQTVPSNMLTLFNLAIDFLVKFCGASVVLCSATQPCLESSVHPIRSEIRDLIQYDAKLWEPFRRTEIIDAGEMSLTELFSFATNAIHNVSSMLIVCNKKKEAFDLFNSFVCNENYECFHISSAMCLNHRKRVIGQLQDALSKCHYSGKKVLCISTQVIEAGVDISFESVIRLAAGMDNIVQSAGRCNRNGEITGLSNVFIVRLKDENLSHLKDIQLAKDATLDLLESFNRSPEKYGQLTSDSAINYYYKSLYRLMPYGLQNYCISVYDHSSSIYSLLSDNSKLLDTDNHPECKKYCLSQAFKTAGSIFSVFDDNTYDVIVPYGGGKKVITMLSGQYAGQSFNTLKSVLEDAKQFTISLYEWQINQLIKAGGIVSFADGAIMVLQEGYYSEYTGFCEKADNTGFMEV